MAGIRRPAWSGKRNSKKTILSFEEKKVKTQEINLKSNFFKNKKRYFPMTIKLIAATMLFN